MSALGLLNPGPGPCGLLRRANVRSPKADAAAAAAAEEAFVDDREDERVEERVDRAGSGVSAGGGALARDDAAALAGAGEGVAAEAAAAETAADGARADRRDGSGVFFADGGAFLPPGASSTSEKDFVRLGVAPGASEGGADASGAPEAPDEAAPRAAAPPAPGATRAEPGGLPRLGGGVGGGDSALRFCPPCGGGGGGGGGAAGGGLRLPPPTLPAPPAPSTATPWGPPAPGRAVLPPVPVVPAFPPPREFSALRKFNTSGGGLGASEEGSPLPPLPLEPDRRTEAPAPGPAG
ncbi:hypothetical protein ACHAWF_017445 [Thalassiosira exigua]